MSTKTLKIPEKVHTELKVYVAKTNDNMAEFAGFAIMKALQEAGHKFVFPPKKEKSK